MTLEHLGKHFGGAPVLEDVNTTIHRGEFVALLGASGCGKSTLLNLIAGLETPTAGAMEIPAEGVAYMFQDATLYPWLTAAENIDLALTLQSNDTEHRKQTKQDRHDRTRNLLQLVNLDHAQDKRPHELSGGMRQRVALARALAQDKQVLLMDEPFAALDAITRDILHEELTRIWRHTGRTIIFVTHNVREAIHLGQRVLMLSSRPGHIIQEWRLTQKDKQPENAARLATDITAALRQEISRHVA